MNISRLERRVLGVLALGGRICLIRDDDGRTTDIECYTREGWVMTDCTLDMFKSMRSKKVISSTRGGPYRITRQGLEMLRV
ncbi:MULTISPECIES: YjhX family toxin [unclassified Devosia]|uniref:YjhX family toxin n=1 Tax=unclassified Devosia TaxID=196773 RepID=UPI0025D53AD5|nr:YjhX family toxin [Devosia sp.]MCR6634812.1 YjhX family toxin [Devosia sp.]